MDELVERVAAVVLERLREDVAENGRDDGWLGVREAAEYASCSTAAVYSAVAAGRLAHGRVGRAIRIRRSALDGWIERRS